MSPASEGTDVFILSERSGAKENMGSMSPRVRDVRSVYLFPETLPALPSETGLEWCLADFSRVAARCIRKTVCQ